jgi:cytochrome c oxidase subunit 2
MRNPFRPAVAPLCLIALLAVPASAARAAEAGAAAAPRIVEIAAKRFEFTPKEITLKKGETVTLRIHSEDVTHGLFSKKLKIDADIVPGKVLDVTITPTEAGTFTAICNHFCGAGHGNMKLKVVVEE